jgi:hypothetical protein
MDGYYNVESELFFFSSVQPIDSDYVYGSIRKSSRSRARPNNKFNPITIDDDEQEQNENENEAEGGEAEEANEANEANEDNEANDANESNEPTRRRKRRSTQNKYVPSLPISRIIAQAIFIQYVDQPMTCKQSKYSHTTFIYTEQIHT